MSDSSEEEIFSTRHKRQSRNDLAHLFDEQSSVSEDYAPPIYDHILLDFFGTGEEYNIPGAAVVEQEEKNKSIFVDCEKLMQYESRAGDLLKGDSFVLAFLHRNTEYAGHKKLNEMIDVNRRINEFLKLSEMQIEAKYSTFEDCVAMHKYSYDTSSILWKLLLTPEYLYENALIGQRIYEPIEPNAGVSDILINEGIVGEVIDIFVKHPLFTSTIVHVVNINNNPIEILSRYFLHDVNANLIEQSKNFSSFDELRHYILRSAIKLVGNLEQKISHKTHQINKKVEFYKIVDSTLDKILTGGKPIAEDELAMGIFYSKNVFYCSVIDFKGRCVKYFQTRDINSIQKIDVVFSAIGSYEKGIKNVVLQIPGVILVDLELVHALYDSNDSKAFSTGIARRVSQIEIEYVRACTNKIHIKNNLLSNEESMDAFELGTRLGLAFVGIDVNKLRLGEFNHVISFINLDFDFFEQITAYGHIDSLDQLTKTGILTQHNNLKFITRIPHKKLNSISSVFERPNDFDNVCVYLRASATFDRFFIHPINYQHARILCSAASEDSIDSVLNNTSILNFDMTEIRKIYPQMDWIGECITHSHRQLFTSVPDKVIHEEIYGELCGSVEGRVSYISRTAIFIDGIVKRKNLSINPLFFREKNTIYFNYTSPLENSDEQICTVDIVVRKDTDEYFQNQIVSVNINDPSFSTLSYNGTIISHTRSKRLRFTEHPLFMNYTAKGIEQHLHASKRTLGLRKSGQGSYGIVTLRLFLRNDEVYQHIKFEEIDNKILCRNISFEDCDEMICYFGRKLRLIDKLRKYKGNIVFELVKDQPGLVKVSLEKGHSKKSELIKIENVILIGNKKFRTLDDYLKYRNIK